MAESKPYGVGTGRIRTIKPEYFHNETLFDLEVETGLPIRAAYPGLWCQCDREGRFPWRPRMLKTRIAPYDNCDFSRVLHALASRGFVVGYRVDGVEFGWIPGFVEHQIVNNRERASKIPECGENAEIFTTSTRAPRVPHASTMEGNGKEGNGKEGKLPIVTPTEAGETVPKKQSKLSLIVQAVNAARIVKNTQTLRCVNIRKPNNMLSTFVKDPLITADEVILMFEHAAAKWSGDPATRDYIRQATLFQPSKREDYLSAAQDWNAEGRPAINSGFGGQQQTTAQRLGLTNIGGPR